MGYIASKSSSSTKKRSKSKSSNRKKKYRRGTHKKRYQRKPHTAGKRKDTSHRRIRYTKKNQPYIIMASGKARFIKKSTVRNARKRKGGMY